MTRPSWLKGARTVFASRLFPAELTPLIAIMNALPELAPTRAWKIARIFWSSPVILSWKRLRVFSRTAGSFGSSASVADNSLID